MVSKKKQRQKRKHERMLLKRGPPPLCKWKGCGSKTTWNKHISRYRRYCIKHTREAAWIKKWVRGKTRVTQTNNSSRFSSGYSKYD